MTTAFRKHISLGIIWCLMVSSVGCYTRQLVQSPKEANHSDLYVTLHSGERYHLTEFLVLPDSSVQGDGYCLDSVRTFFSGTFEKQQISQMSYDKLSIGRTALAAAAATSFMVYGIMQIDKNAAKSALGFLGFAAFVYVVGWHNILGDILEDVAEKNR